MRHSLIAAVVAAALVSGAGVASAQSNPMSYEAMNKAKQGSWAEYTMTMPGGPNKMTVRYAVVEKNERELTMETDSQTPMGPVHLRAKVVDAKREKTFSAERVAFTVSGHVLRSPRLLAAAQRAASASRKLVARKGRIRRLPPPLGGWTETRDAPAPPPESFRAWWIRTRGRS